MIAKKVFFLAIFSLAVSLLFGQWPVGRCQSDWHSGAGLSDTTDEWGERYFSGGGINDAVVPLMLLADPTSYDYTNWTSHTIDNSTEIGTFNWCVRPAEINGDGYIDIVANISDDTETTGRVVWYEGPASGWTYTRHDIHTYTPVDACAGSYPADIDNDGDIDVVAGDNLGLYWFENDGTGGGWTQHNIYTTTSAEYHAWYYDVEDADGDGWKDVLVTEIEGDAFFGYSAYTTLYWNSSAGPDYFDGTYILIDNFGTGEGQFWRALFFDPDPTDGLLDIAYEKVSVDFFGFDEDSLIVKVQNPARTFTPVYSHRLDCAPDIVGNPTAGHDGLWNNDFDGDGDEDLVVGAFEAGNGFFFLVQSDPGDVFSYHFLFNDPSIAYMDGAIMFDMDGDGMQDVVGVFDSLAYWRRTGTGYTDFALYHIDNIANWSHWVYPYNMDRGICSGDADIDAIITEDDNIIIYENQMFSYVTTGSLYSAILGIPLPSDTCVVCSLYWEGCQIPEYTISIAARVGESVSDCQSASWGTVSNNPYHETGYDHGWYAGAIHTPVDTIWVQYYINFNRSGGTVDLSPLIDSVWVKVFPIPCECEDIQAMWTCPTPCFSFSSCSTQVMQMLMWTDSTTIDTSQTFFTVDDGFTTYPLYEPSSNLSFVCLTPNCDSVFVEISNIPWTDGATVTISLDSAYTDDGCLTTWP